MDNQTCSTEDESSENFFNVISNRQKVVTIVFFKFYIRINNSLCDCQQRMNDENGKVEYRVKWEANKENTCEPPENVDSPTLIQAYEDRVQEKGKSKEEKELPGSEQNVEYCHRQADNAVSKKSGPSSNVNVTYFKC